MGNHVVQLLANAGHRVFVTSRRRCERGRDVAYVSGDAKDLSFLKSILHEQWDVVIDFMVWSTEDFAERLEGFLSSTAQYVFVSSYRVYADSPILTESSPRLLDVARDAGYLATDEYALAKARCENMLISSDKRNWTIVRPAITYDGSGRFQLGVLEAETWLWRALSGVSVPFPEEMLNKRTTMTWGGDVARMIVGLIGNPVAFGGIFTVSTSESRTWTEVIRMYQKVVPLEIVSCSLADFERARGGVYQIKYDRMYDRVIDNSKILCATGLSQFDLAPIEENLTAQLEYFLANDEFYVRGNAGANAKLDRIIGGCPSLYPMMKDGKWLLTFGKYVIRRMRL